LSKKKGFRLERRKPFGLYFLDWLRGLDLNQRPSGYEGEIAHYSKQQQPTTANEISAGRELLSVGFGWCCTQFSDTYTDTFGVKKQEPAPRPPRAPWAPCWLTCSGGDDPLAFLSSPG
jgi:hypothetical protein